MEAKRQLLLAKLDERHKSQKTNVDGDNRTQDGGGDSNEFQNTFYAEVAELTEKINSIKSGALSGGADQLELFSEKAAKLQRMLNESTHALSAHQVRKSMTVMRDLQDELKQLRQKNQPKGRFAFSNKAKTASAQTTTKIQALKSSLQTGNDTVDCGNQPSEDITDLVRVADLRNQVIVVGDECLDKKVLIVDCHDCSIKVVSRADNIQMKGLRRCTVACAPVSTSIFIEECDECVFALASQQLRVHTTFNSDIYLLVSSRAIIEDSRRLRFAPYMIETDNTTQTILTAAGFDLAKNHWDKVEDFNWLVADRASPNWEILPAEDRRKFERSWFSSSNCVV